MSIPASRVHPAGDRPAPSPTLNMVVVGGCGHVGLPLALSFADAGLSVGIFDVDRDKIEQVRSGLMPFMEHGAQELLEKVLANGHLSLSADPEMIRRTDVVVLVIGTPIDEFMNPSMRLFERVVDELRPLTPSRTLLILRSTVYPGTTEYVEQRFADAGVDVDVVFCPERIAEGHAIEELRSLPQIIGARTDEAFERAARVFRVLDVDLIRTTPREAELVKLFNNTWRYMKFAVANQFFQIAHGAGVDYGAVLHAIRHNYPRGADLPGPGFAAGPCLLKDTMQLAAFSPDHVPLGHAAMLINEGLPGYIVDTLDRAEPLRGRTVGILGMAFKGESDDSRTSLSYKLRKLLAFKGATVLCTDPYVRDPQLLPLSDVLQASEILIIGAPHRVYRTLDLEGRRVVDIWNATGAGIVL